MDMLGHDNSQFLSSRFLDEKLITHRLQHVRCLQDLYSAYGATVDCHCPTSVHIRMIYPG